MPKAMHSLVIWPKYAKVCWMRRCGAWESVVFFRLPRLPIPQVKLTGIRAASEMSFDMQGFNMKSTVCTQLLATKHFPHVTFQVRRQLLWARFNCRYPLRKASHYGIVGRAFLGTTVIADVLFIESGQVNKPQQTWLHDAKSKWESADICSLFNILQPTTT